MTIEGFDEETAQELQARAQDFIEEENKKLDAERRELGVADDLVALDGLDLKMVVALGKEDVKSVEDLAGCATDDLTGWTERVDGEAKHYYGMLEAFNVSPEAAEDLIMRARLQAGWITEEDLAAMAADEEAEENETEETAG